MIIPFTMTHTNLQDAVVGTRVNLEFDMVAKYVRTLVAPYVASRIPFARVASARAPRTSPASSRVCAR